LKPHWLETGQPGTSKTMEKPPGGQPLTPKPENFCGKLEPIFSVEPS